MKIAVSFLGIKNNLTTNIKKLNQLDFDYFHFDIMDGNFVKNKSRTFLEDQEIAKLMKKKFDIHLMVSDVKAYIDQYQKLKPMWLTFHVEVRDVDYLIDYLKSKNIKVGLSLKPKTKIEKLIPYLDRIDQVLIMSVEPGYGGQLFLKSAIKKIDYLYEYRQKHNLKYLIQVDGGINDKTIAYCKNADIAVVGSFITNKNYQQQIELLKENL